MARLPNVFGLMMVRDGEADAFLSGLTYDYPTVLRPILQFIPLQSNAATVAGVFMVISGRQVYFFADGLVNIDPGPEDLAEIAILTSEFAHDFDIEPRVALVSFSNFGSSRHPRAEKVRQAAEIVRERRPDIQVEGEMQADTALSAQIVESRFPFSRVRDANVLVFANLDASLAAFKVVAEIGQAYVLGPILLGPSRSVHPLHPDADVQSLLLVGALAVVEAQEREREAMPPADVVKAVE
jgi:malate dehydrogenase (oxaloacetate-decarboxylating)(NADP+)